MSQTLTGVNGGTFPNQCNGPSAGDLITANSINNGRQAILNECKYLYDSLYPTRDLLGLGLEIVGPGALWTGTIAGGDGVAMQTVALDTTVAAPLTLLHTIKIRTIKVRVAPSAHAGLPGTMPVLRLMRITLNGVLSTSWSVTDPSTPVATYNAAHDVTLDLGADETIDKTAFFYLLQFDGEGGANKADLNIGQPRIEMIEP